MRFLKMLGLAVIAAAALTAFVGATSASARSAIDVCLYSSKTTPALTQAGCESVAGTIDNEATKITYTAEAKNPILKGSLEEKCEKSDSTTKSTGAKSKKTKEEWPEIEVSALTFTGNCSPCPTVDTAPPYLGEIIMEGENYFLKVPGSATLLGCFGFVNCKFSSEAVTLKYVSGANHTNNEFRAEAEKLTGPGGLCGTSGTWTANYVVSSPSQWFLFLL